MARLLHGARKLCYKGKINYEQLFKVKTLMVYRLNNTVDILPGTIQITK